MGRFNRSPRFLFMYILGYLLLMEWLLPLPEVTDTGFIPVFIVGAAFFFLVTFLSFPWWGTMPLMIFGILFGIHFIFFEASFLNSLWWGMLFSDLRQNVVFLLSGNWVQFSDIFRSLLFLILLSIMSYLIYFWVVYARRILFFFICTVIYIGVMDTFLPYDGRAAVMRVFIIGFVLLALLQWDRLFAHFPSTKRKKLWLRWSIVSILLLVVAAAVGMVAPKAEPQWPDPVPYLEVAAGVEDGIVSRNVRKIGYGDNDERLGGGFQMDETPVFTAIGQEGGYWRGESKNIYTGHGWVSDTPEEFYEESLFYEDAVDVERQQMEVIMNDGRGYEFAFYPGALKRVDVPEVAVQTMVHYYTGKASTWRESTPYEVHAYTLTYDKPVYPIDVMRNRSQDDPDDIKEHFLSLPEDLPSSIQELAEEITAEENNRYDKVRAVEAYFHRGDFTYDTTNVPVPEEGEDYVEQFLFETKRGYCDNFSTSMAVMLRTLDIPTRWVKGFTSGEVIERTSEQTVYEITNANAHSWVEVYFPDVGWVPFEPTRGFSSDFEYSLNQTDENTEDEESTEEDEQEREEEEEEEKEEEDTFSFSSIEFPTWPFIVTAIIVVGAGVLFRIRIFKKVLLFRYQHFKNAHGYSRAFQALLRLMEYAGLKKEKSETLREFAMRIDKQFETNDMSQLVKVYEEIHYGKKDGNESSTYPLTSWENMIRRIKA